MKKKICINCSHWASPHEGMVDSNDYGTCNLLSNLVTESPDDIRGVVEGCVSVYNRTEDFEFVTGKDFGCIYHSKIKL